jgi:DNA-binding NarL/FixJ family response regulator
VSTPVTRSKTPIRVLLVDDHQVVAEALGSALARFDIEIVGVAHSLGELQALRAERPDVVLMDYRLPDGTGADGCRVAKARWPSARVVILTGFEDDDALVATLTAGADGFMLKSRRIAAVVEGIRAAFERHPVLSPAMLGALAQRLGNQPSKPIRPEHPRPESLTPRELTVLRALANGAATRTIAHDLGLSEGTVRVHVEAIRRKFHVSSRLEAVTSAIHHHIVEVAAY